MSELIHISIDDILSGWQSSCSYKDYDVDKIDECSVGRVAQWGAHYICVIHSDVPEDERQELAEFISKAPETIHDLEKEIAELKAAKKLNVGDLSHVLPNLEEAIAVRR